LHNTIEFAKTKESTTQPENNKSASYSKITANCISEFSFFRRNTRRGSCNLAALATLAGIVMPSKKLAAYPDSGLRIQFEDSQPGGAEEKGSFCIFPSKCRFDKTSRLAASQSQWVLHFNVLAQNSEN